MFKMLNPDNVELWAILTSKKYVRIYSILFMFLTLTVVLASKYFVYEGFVEDNISRIDVIAKESITVINHKETELRKEHAIENVEPLLEPIQASVNKLVEDDLARILYEVNVIKSSRKSSVEQIRDFNALLKVEQPLLEFLVEMPYSRWIVFKDKVVKITRMILEEGVTQENIISNDLKFIQKYLPHTDSQYTQESMTSLIYYVLKPNRVVNKKATQDKIEQITSQVEPIYVTYKKGQKVVERGEIITPVQMEALQALGYIGSKFNANACIGVVCLVTLFVYTTVYYLKRFANEYFENTSKFFITMLLISLASLFLRFLPDYMPIYLLPVASISLLLSIITTPRVAILLSSLTLLLCGVTLQYNLVPISVFIAGVVVAGISVSQLDHKKRSELASTGLVIGFIQFLTIISIDLLNSGIDMKDINLILIDAVSGVMSGCLSGIITIGVLPYLENTFKIVTPYTIAELGDYNHPILKRMQFEAPGTYQHSLVVGNLSVAAAEAIGADANLVKVGCMFHDIGKVKRPLFYIENQSYFGVENPHDKLNPRLSKMIITAHPKDGLDMAKHYGLPDEISQFMDKHHGTGVTGYFYHQACKEEGAENVDIDLYRHSGRKPDSRETAIVMLADSAESAVRSLNKPTAGAVESMVNKIFKSKIDDGQLDEAPLTLKELQIVHDVFCRVLRGIHHARIEYPDAVQEELNKQQNQHTQNVKVTDIHKAKKQA